LAGAICYLREPEILSKGFLVYNEGEITSIT